MLKNRYEPDPKHRRRRCAVLRHQFLEREQFRKSLNWFVRPLWTVWLARPLPSKSRAGVVRSNWKVRNGKPRQRTNPRAYELWEQAGKPDGRDQEFYHQAEQKLRDEDKSSLLRTPDNL
jgi:hypothetical protein